MTSLSRFDKSQLPPARPFYEAELGKLGREDRHGWCAANCPLHESKSHRSFAVNVRTGGFLCRAGCGQGGDVLDFVKLRYRLDFKGAKNYLRIDDSAVSAAVETVPVAWLLCDFSIDGVNYRAAVKDEPRDYAGRIRRFYRQARERLTELGLDKSETKAAEVCWTRMALALDELREMEIL